jgi:hypothetical protein
MPLTPLINKKTDILFIPLNPPNGSAKVGHYFAENNIFWDSLYLSDLINEPPAYVRFVTPDNCNFIVAKIKDKFADEQIFKTRLYNYKYFGFSIHDIAPDFVCSESKKVHPQTYHFKILMDLLDKLKPKFAIIMHQKVRDEFLLEYTQKPILNVEKQKFIIRFDKEIFEKYIGERKKMNDKNPNFGSHNGPYGRILKDLSTNFFSIPFPSIRNGIQADHTDFWKCFKNFIDEILKLEKSENN